ncbi:polysaccharide biosynthesis C-terminal domain-containing protein [Sinomonas sp. JGH33]|uniref:Polysaccharide biosynthesis C-terminal domain-containing protein n=1 Tax=Sinomonas terricola TaxID=3110330 RepID=A0ABU5TBC3_9MICC|nr:polysaccharide biosynthesis C-terminal domain-containing protein [Sinomonas sp. JGH33]MEA5456994.1 polysaccharide biosynthesis C-terminal domain-containing protein [Sinomonas sp. JGH33]
MLAFLYLLAARGSSPQQLGSAVSAIAIATAAVGFIDFGTNSHWVREISRGSMDPHELGRRLTVKIVAALAAGIVWVGVVSLVRSDSMLWTATPVMLGLIINQTSQVALRAAARGELVAIMILCDRIAAFLIFLVLIVAGLSSASVLWISLTCGSLVSASLGWLFVEGRHRPVPAFSLRTNPWRGAGFFGVSSLANSAQSLDLPILSIVAGPAAAGLFGAVNRWTQPMSLLAAAFSAASAPFVSRSSDVIDAWRHVRQAVWMPASAVALSTAVAIAAPALVPLLLGDGYVGSVESLRVLAFVSIFSILSQPLMVILQSLGHDRYTALCMGTAVALQLLAVAIMGAAYGSLGAAYASLITQILIFGAFVVRVVRIYRHARAAVLAETGK